MTDISCSNFVEYSGILFRNIWEIFPKINSNVVDPLKAEETNVDKWTKYSVWSFFFLAKWWVVCRHPNLLMVIVAPSPFWQIVDVICYPINQHIIHWPISNIISDGYSPTTSTYSHASLMMCIHCDWVSILIFSMVFIFTTVFGATLYPYKWMDGWMDGWALRSMVVNPLISAKRS